MVSGRGLQPDLIGRGGSDIKFITGVSVCKKLSSVWR